MTNAGPVKCQAMAYYHAMQTFYLLLIASLLYFKPPCNLYFIIYLGIAQYFFVIVVLNRDRSTHKY